MKMRSPAGFPLFEAARADRFKYCFALSSGDDLRVLIFSLFRGSRFTGRSTDWFLFRNPQVRLWNRISDLRSLRGRRQRRSFG